jgi:hypothetical protein
LEVRRFDENEDLIDERLKLSTPVVATMYKSTLIGLTTVSAQEWLTGWNSGIVKMSYFQPIFCEAVSESIAEPWR